MATAAAQWQGIEGSSWSSSAAAIGGPAVAPPAVDAGNDALVAELSRVARGDQQAFERFYDATLPRVFAIVRRVCADAALAEEVVEDVYVQVWREASRFDVSRGAALAWLLMMARSRALDALRRREPAVVMAEPESLIDEPDADADPLGLLAAMRRDSEVRQVLALLPVRERQMIALAFFRGLTHAEIASAMRLPLGSVKTTIRRALSGLRGRLAGADLATAPSSGIDDENGL